MISYHEAADIFPLLSNEDFESLKKDIAKNGQLEPIWLLDGEILDGRNRYRACAELGIEPQFREYKGESPVAFVWSLNGTRRHLTATQKAFIGQRFLPMLEAEAKARQGARTDLDIPEKIPESKAGESREKAAEIVGVNPRYISDAKRIREENPELADACESGGLSISKAKKMLKPHVSHNSGENEWYTPIEYVELARDVMGGIDLDPASCDFAQESIKASKHLTIIDDGLAHRWVGRVWLNPPYESGLIEKFCEKLAQSTLSDDVSEFVLLVNNATETRWFQSIAKVATCVCMTRGRIRYIAKDGQTKNSPLQGQCFLYNGPNSERFIEKFSAIGCVYSRSANA